MTDQEFKDKTAEIIQKWEMGYLPTEELHYELMFLFMEYKNEARWILVNTKIHKEIKLPHTKD